MAKKTAAAVAEQVHDATVRRLGPGVYRAEDSALGAVVGCGWVGPVREGLWWEARAAAEADADEHSGREARRSARGTTPTRPVRISDDLWNGVLAVSVAEGVTASEVLRSAIAAYGPVSEAMETLASAEVA